MLPLIAVFGCALVLLLVCIGSGRGFFRVPFVEWFGFHVLMHDPPVHGAALCVVLVCVFLGFAWVFDWNRIGEEGFSGSFCGLAGFLRSDV